MTWPPSILRVSIPREHKPSLRLWIPLFLLWPLVAAIAIAVSPLFVLGVAVWGRPGRRRTLLLSGPVLFLLFCAARGLRIEARDGDGEFAIALI